MSLLSTQSLPLERETLRRGQVYAQLKVSDGFKELLDFLEQRADAALGELRACLSSDALVIKGFILRWKEREDTLKAVQAEVENAIEEMKEMGRQLKEHRVNGWEEFDNG